MSDMKRFVFNLEALLRHRKYLEEKERNELARLHGLHQSEVNHRATLQQQVLATLGELARQRQGVLDHGELSWCYLYLDRLRLELDQSAERILSLEKKIQGQKTLLFEAQKKRKVIDALKARRRRYYLAAADREEQKLIDELVVTKFAQAKA